MSAPAGRQTPEEYTAREQLQRVREGIEAEIADKERDKITLEGEISGLYSALGRVKGAELRLRK